MNPALIMFGIQSVIRLGRISNDALEQWARDDDAIFPALQDAQFERETFINGFFNKNEYESFVKGETAPYAEFWQGDAVKPEKTAIDALYTAAVKISTEKGVAINQWHPPTNAAVLVAQWDPEKGPISPWARIILTAGDIALEYVSANPSVLGSNPNGEKLIAAYASNLSDLLPNDGNFGVKENFAQRLTGAFLRAGLDTISQNPEWLVSGEHLQKLIASSVTPLVEAFPDSITEQLKWQEVADTIIGPAACAALETVARHQTAFLGADFNPNKALGAVTRALFLETAKNGLQDQLTSEGLLGLYRAALNVAAERPQLFLGDKQRAEDIVAKELFSQFAKVLKDAESPFDGAVGIALASAALESVGNNIHRFIKDTDPWEQTAADMVHSLATKLKKAFDANEKLEGLFSKSQLIELGRILLSRIAETPQMILGSGDEAWTGVLTAISNAMKEDKNLLLTGNDWIEITKVMAEEVSANPERLFKLNPADPEDILAGKLISIVLKSSGEILATPDLKGRAVLYGKTLREAVIIVLRATSGNAKAAQEHLGLIEELIKKLNTIITQNSGHFGSKEWLRLFRIALSAVLDGRGIPEITLENANELLKGGL